MINRIRKHDDRHTYEDIAGAATPHYVDGVSMLPTATTDAPFLRDFAYTEKLGPK